MPLIVERDLLSSFLVFIFHSLPTWKWSDEELLEPGHFENWKLMCSSVRVEMLYRDTLCRALFFSFLQLHIPYMQVRQIVSWSWFMFVHSLLDKQNIMFTGNINIQNICSNLGLILMDEWFILYWHLLYLWSSMSVLEKKSLKCFAIGMGFVHISFSNKEGKELNPCR